MNMRFNQKWIAAALFFIVIAWLYNRKEGYDVSDWMAGGQFSPQNMMMGGTIRPPPQPPVRPPPQPPVRQPPRPPPQPPVRQGERQGMSFPSYKGFECKMTPPNKFGCQAL